MFFSFLIFKPKIMNFNKSVKSNGIFFYKKTNQNHKVVGLYCTYNDINEESIKANLYQKYQNYKLVILDDSSEPE
jgi:hypothetical protein